MHCPPALDCCVSSNPCLSHLLGQFSPQFIIHYPPTLVCWVSSHSCSLYTIQLHWAVGSVLTLVHYILSTCIGLLGQFSPLFIIHYPPALGCWVSSHPCSLYTIHLHWAVGSVLTLVHYTLSTCIGPLGQFSPLFIIHYPPALGCWVSSHPCSSCTVPLHLTIWSVLSPVHHTLPPCIGLVHHNTCIGLVTNTICKYSWPLFCYCRESGRNPWGGGSADPGAQRGFSLDFHDLQNHHWLSDHSTTENTQLSPAWLLHLQLKQMWSERWTLMSGIFDLCG